MNTSIQQAYLFLQQGRPHDALQILTTDTHQRNADLNLYFLRGIAFSMTGDKLAAIAAYRQLLEISPNNAGARMNLGVDLYALEQYEEALEHLTIAQGIEPQNPMIALNLGNIYKATGAIEQALHYYDQAIALHPGYAEAWSNRGDALCGLGRTNEAITSYKESLRLNPNYVDALNNLGLTYIETRDFEQGVEIINRAISINPNFAMAYNNLGIAYVRTQRYEQGLAAYKKSIALEPHLPDPYFNAAEALSGLRDYEQAIELYQLAAKNHKKPEELLGPLLHAKMKICDWADFNTLTSSLLDAISNKACSVSPFTILGLPSTAAQQKQCAESFVAKVIGRAPSTTKVPAPPASNTPRKIRIGYLSSDFYAHATAFLMAELFELHDQERFEIILFSYGNGPKDGMQHRLQKAVHKFHHMDQLSDQQAAALIQSEQIDILVDLKGHTEGARLGILNHRPAPIQVHYLGYPGTLGAPFIDYLIADSVLIKPEDYPHYTEKIVHLPGCYQANDRQRRIAETTDNRTDHGLPETGFVYCCFNNNWKITPLIFNAWARILNNTPGSVLWLIEDNPLAAHNLRAEATKRDINPDRLIFAPKLPLPEHLARHRHADLFLDTPFYNAHTTASDALWGGLPVLTLAGNTFASRVGASLLKATGTADLVAKDLSTYEESAIALANHPDELKEIRSRLESNLKGSVLFDTPGFTRTLEAAYTAMFERSSLGLTAEHITIPTNTR